MLAPSCSRPPPVRGATPEAGSYLRLIDFVITKKKKKKKKVPLRHPQHRFRAKREQLKSLQGLLPENLALNVVYVPYSLDSGPSTDMFPFYYTVD